MKKSKWNGGWTAALAGWLSSAILFPFLPEIMRWVFDGAPLNLFRYPVMEYVGTIAFWGALFLLVWIPAGFKASGIYGRKGTGPSIRFVILVFLVMLAVLGVIFRFFWNS